MHNKVQQFIRQHHLLESDGRYLVALSGGADSVTLLLVLKELGYYTEAVHCNFRLRGGEADRDEKFCQTLCDEMGISLHLAHFDTRTYAALHKVSIEMAARELRYAYFEQLRNDLQMDGVCVAHHRDDNVETILMNLIRGTGIHGMTGMAPENGYILRPLLDVSRDEIEHFLHERGQAYVTDSTNLTADVVRNKIRLNILPQLKDINPAVADNILRTARHMAEAEKVLDDLVSPMLQTLRNDGFIEKNLIFQSPSPEYLLYQLLTPFGFQPPQIMQMAARPDMQTGTLWQSKTHELLFDRGRMMLRPMEEQPSKVLRIPETGTYVYDDSLKVGIRQITVNENFSIPKGKTHICLDASKITFPLMLRPCQEGDRFIPFGMNGSKLVSDYLTDCKKTLFDKRRQLVLTQSNGDILWLLGERPDNRFRITSSTIDALSLEIQS